MSHKDQKHPTTSDTRKLQSTGTVDPNLEKVSVDDAANSLLSKKVLADLEQLKVLRDAADQHYKTWEEDQPDFSISTKGGRFRVYIRINISHTRAWIIGGSLATALGTTITFIATHYKP